MNEITVRPVMSADAHQAQIQAIQQVLSSVMIDGKHYGKIPGCGEKPALLKPGAEKIMATFGIRPEVEAEQVPTGDDHVRYRVTVRALSHDGVFLGEGVGECSTAEDKFAWEAADSDEHFDATPADRRRIKWKYKRQTKQVRANPSDKANTVLKMAKKRALVDMVLTVTAASDIFEQDIDEDFSPEDAPKPIKKPQAKKAAKPVPQGAARETGKIDRVHSKEGDSDKGPWKRTGIQLNGDWYSTFDKTIGEACERFDKSGAVVCVHYEDDKNGRKILSIAEYRDPEQEALEQ